MNTKFAYPIEDGPSADRILDSLKYAYDKRDRVHVDFKVAKSYTGPKDEPGTMYQILPMGETKIVGVTHEDGSGSSFLLKGYARGVDGEPNTVTVPFDAYYNAKTRKGHITFKGRFGAQHEE